MANCAIYQKGSDKITYFVKDCIQSGRDFKGSSMSLTGVKEYLFDTKWTEDIAHAIINDKGEITGYDKNVHELTEAKRYHGIVVSSRKDVDAITVKRIREKYTIDDEFRLNRKNNSTEWNEYDTYVEALVIEGKQFKDKYFPER